MARKDIPVVTYAGYGGGADNELAAMTTTFVADDNAEFVNNGRTFLVVYGNGGAVGVTVDGVANNRTFGSAPSVAIAATNGEISIYGPFEPSAFNQSGGTCNVNFSDATNLEMYAFTYTPWN